MPKKYKFTSESVSEGHPDKIADQISDAILDEYLRHEPNSKVACETLVTTGLVFCAGETRAKKNIDLEKVVRETIKDIGYTKAEYQFDSNSCAIISTIHKQSDDIYLGLNKKDIKEQGAGDQGIMFGYACKETDNYMPATIEIANTLLKELASIRKDGNTMTYLRPDSKSQVTIEYEDNIPVKIDTIVISTQHDENVLVDDIRQDVIDILIPRVMMILPKKLSDLFFDFKVMVNPTGKFVVGGPHGDTGLTGRKIIVDTYGGRGASGGGSLSSKDGSKVDRSASYMARYIAKNAVAAGIADEMLVQISYAIGVSNPVSFYVNTYGTGKFDDDIISEKLFGLFDLRPYSIIEKFGLKDPIFKKTASYGHFGRNSYESVIEVYYKDHTTYTGESGKTYKIVKYFGWEELDMINEIKNLFYKEKENINDEK